MPNGLIADLFGPVPSNRHDAAMLRQNMALKWFRGELHIFAVVTSGKTVVSKMLKNLNWDTLEQRRKTDRLTMMYKNLQNLVGNNNSQYLTKSVDRRTRGSYIGTISSDLWVTVCDTHHQILVILFIFTQMMKRCWLARLCYPRRYLDNVQVWTCYLWVETSANIPGYLTWQ